MINIEQQKKDWHRERSELEVRRTALGISKRALALEAGLNEAYYQHLSNQNFEFPTLPKLEAIRQALTRLEKIRRFSETLKSGQTRSASDQSPHHER